MLRHQGGLPHKCEVCNMTFQSRSHLIKHATSHTRKTQVVSTKINNFLESFSASLGDDMLGGMEDQFSGGASTSGKGGGGSAGADDNSVRLSVDTIPEALEAAAAEAAFAFGQHSDLHEDLLATSDEVAVGGGGGGAVASTSSTLQCDICMESLKDKRAYIIHMKHHAGMLSLRCRFCSEVFQV